MCSEYFVQVGNGRMVHMRQQTHQPQPWRRFLRGFLRSPRTVGSILPSSRFLVQAMLEAAQIERAHWIAEFGPGTGVFTDSIVRQMLPSARLLVFEIDEHFTNDLRARIHDPRVTILQHSAATIGATLHEYGASHVDCVISGLPFTSLPRAVSHEILRATVAALRPGGVFVTYQYTPLLRNLFRSYFATTTIARMVLRNVPPALVFVCRTQPQ